MEEDFATIDAIGNINSDGEHTRGRGGFRGPKGTFRGGRGFSIRGVFRGRGNGFVPRERGGFERGGFRGRFRSMVSDRGFRGAIRGSTFRGRGEFRGVFRGRGGLPRGRGGYEGGLSCGGYSSRGSFEDTRGGYAPRGRFEDGVRGGYSSYPRGSFIPRGDYGSVFKRGALSGGYYGGPPVKRLRVDERFGSSSYGPSYDDGYGAGSYNGSGYGGDPYEYKPRTIYGGQYESRGGYYSSAGTF